MDWTVCPACCLTHCICLWLLHQADKFSFANGTGSSKKNKRRNSVGRAISHHARRR
jgi:hypothetical protein